MKHYWSYAVWHPLCDINKKIYVYEIDNDQCDSQSNKESSSATPIHFISIIWIIYRFPGRSREVTVHAVLKWRLLWLCRKCCETEIVGVAGSRQNTVLGENDRKAEEDVVGRTRERGLSISMRDRRQPTQNCWGSNPFVLLTSFLQ